MTTTPRLGAPELVSGQATPETTVNEQIRYIEAGAGHFIFKDRDLATPPGSPADGDCYLVAASATGAWAGQDGKIAFRINTAWAFITAIEGFTAWVNDENAFFGYDGAAWQTLSSPSGTYQPLDGDLTAIAALSGTNTIYYRSAANTWTAVTIGSNLSFSGGTLAASVGASAIDDLSDVAITSGAQGDIIYRNATQWVNLPAGTSGQYLKTQGAGANPVWATVAGGGGSAWHLQWGPLQNEPPSSNYATLDTRNGHPTLDFDTTTQEAAVFTGVLPAGYGGNGITVSIWCSLTSATTGTVGWLVSIERIDASSLDIDADSFTSAQTVTATTVPGTSGQVLKMSVNISNGANMDSLAAGELFRIKIERDVTNDTAAGDAELLRVMMVEQ